MYHLHHFVPFSMSVSSRLYLVEGLDGASAGSLCIDELTAYHQTDTRSCKRPTRHKA